jgi:hypothetical protein
LILFFKVDGSPGMEMKEKYSLKWGMRTEMENTLDHRIRSSKVSSGQSISAPLTSLHNPTFPFINKSPLFAVERKKKHYTYCMLNTFNNKKKKKIDTVSLMACMH